MKLLVVDTVQIQSYIFGSNRLRENIGASFLVDRATSDWVFESLSSIRNNVRRGKIDQSARIEYDTELDAEVIYSGGGNCAVIFREAEQARASARYLSERVLIEAPGLQLLIHQATFDWDQQCLADVLENARKAMQREKDDRATSKPLGPLGVTATCPANELAATQFEPHETGQRSGLIDESVAAKQRVSDGDAGPTNSLLLEKLPLSNGFKYPNDLDHLGRSRDEFSHIAVVHADGDGIGKRILKIAENARHTSKNRQFIQDLREFSQALSMTAGEALRLTLQDLESSIMDDAIAHCVNGIELRRIELRRDQRTQAVNLPFRPLVFGGDDVTFVCDGRIGLALAIQYMQHFEKITASSLPDGNGKATASAGVAIVKSHYPFSRAYNLAAELCQSAKHFKRAMKTEINSSCIDWHFAQSGLTGTLEQIRQREYRVAAGSLTVRPVTLGEMENELRTWRCVQSGIEAFQGTDWLSRRNKVKALRDALREGPSSVSWFIQKFNACKTLPGIGNAGPPLMTEGWQDGYCPYFDAVELIDWYVPLCTN